MTGLARPANGQSSGLETQPAQCPVPPISRCPWPASVQARDGAKLLLCMFCHSFLSLLMIFADGGYAGKLEEFVQRMGRLFGHGTSFGLGIIKKLTDQKGFIVLPRRWVIESGSRLPQSMC